MTLWLIDRPVSRLFERSWEILFLGMILPFSSMVSWCSSFQWQHGQTRAARRAKPSTAARPAGAAGPSAPGEVAAGAEAVGLSIEGSGPPAEVLLERRAAVKARRVAEHIQSAATLSGRGIAADDLARLESAIADELLLGSPRRLWS